MRYINVDELTYMFSQIRMMEMCSAFHTYFSQVFSEKRNGLVQQFQVIDQNTQMKVCTDIWPEVPERCLFF